MASHETHFLVLSLYKAAALCNQTRPPGDDMIKAFAVSLSVDHLYTSFTTIVAIVNHWWLSAVNYFGRLCVKWLSFSIPNHTCVNSLVCCLDFDFAAVIVISDDQSSNTEWFQLLSTDAQSNENVWSGERESRSDWTRFHVIRCVTALRTILLYFLMFSLSNCYIFLRQLFSGRRSSRQILTWMMLWPTVCRFSTLMQRRC